MKIIMYRMFYHFGKKYYQKVDFENMTVSTNNCDHPYYYTNVNFTFENLFAILDQEDDKIKIFLNHNIDERLLNKLKNIGFQ